MISSVSLKSLYVGLLAVMAGALLLGGCRAGGFLDLQGGALSPPETKGFNADLADEYQVLAEFTATTAGKQALAAIFYEKSENAARGTLVPPESLADYKIPAFAKDELRAARVELMNGLQQANAPENAPMLAMAQVKFDCWLAYQPYQKKEGDYIGCRDAYYQAMKNVDFLKQQPQEQAAPPLASTSPRTIHFINDTMTLDQGAHAAIAALAAGALAQDDTGILLTGYSKTAATIEDTSNNAVRRIIAVRNALYQNGVDPTLVDIEFIKGGDPQNVDIELLPGTVEENG